MTRRGSRVALSQPCCRQLSPVPTSTAHRTNRGAGSRQPLLAGDPLDKARGLRLTVLGGLRAVLQAAGNVYNLPCAGCGAQLPTQSWPGPPSKAQPVQLHEIPNLSPLEWRATQCLETGKTLQGVPGANTACPDRAQPARSPHAAPSALDWPA